MLLIFITQWRHKMNYKRIQDRRQEPKLCVVRDTPTRWSSILHILNRTQEIKDHYACMLLPTPKIKPLSTSEWLIMSTCSRTSWRYHKNIEWINIYSRWCDTSCSLLENHSSAKYISSWSNEYLSFASEPNIESVIESPQYNKATQVVNIIKHQTMRADAEKWFSWIESDALYRVATYLDPRYKSNFFCSSYITNLVKSSTAIGCEELT